MLFAQPVRSSSVQEAACHAALGIHRSVGVRGAWYVEVYVSKQPQLMVGLVAAAAAHYGAEASRAVACDAQGWPAVDGLQLLL